jgi:RNA polymerase sigma-70 factor (sigma-E family)
VEETVDARGDVAASTAVERLEYEEFVALRGPALVRLARGLLKDPYLAEDVVQDVLARALLQWSRVSAAHDIDAYVRRMVVNACTSWFRRAARRERVTDQPLVLDRPVGDRTDQFVERDQLVTLLRKLPAKQRAVLVLRHYEGLPDAEIARMLGSSEVTVRSNAHRGLARLRELIAESDALAKTGEIKLGAGRRPRRPKA